MAERRMFAKTIIDSDAFIDMPITARLLYYDLGMRADDEGFVNSPKKIMRMVGASQDDLTILISKKFIIPFDSGVVVIKHWKIHNYIQKDRFKETKYTEERAKLGVKESGAYTLDTKCIQTVSNLDTQVSIGKSKSRLGEVSEGNNNMPISEANDHGNEPVVEVISEEESRFETFWGLYPRRVKKPNARKAFDSKCKDEKTFNEIMHGLKKWCDSWVDTEQKYIPYPASWLNGEQWNDEPPRTKREEFAF